MQGPNQEAYDRGTSIFSPNGRLYQVEYAREAVTRGAPVVGVRSADGLALAASTRPQSPLVESRSIEKLHAIDDQILLGSAGHAADTRRLVDLARRAAQEERLRYDQPVTVRELAMTIADHVQEHTQSGGARPYGTALIVAGVDESPTLFEIDPSGATGEWRADALGAGAEAAIDRFEADYDDVADLDDALSLALRGLQSTEEEITSETVDAATVTEHGHEIVPAHRIRALFDGEN